MVDRAAAVLELAQGEGLDCHHLVPLRSTNHAVFLLAECAVVAKVHRSRAAAARELAFGHALAARGAPVVAPAGGVGDEVRHATGLHVTFWDYAAPDTAEPSASAVAEALGNLHRRLAGLADRVGDHTIAEQLDAARRALRDRAFAPLLDTADRRLLHDALSRAVDDTRDSRAVVHGSPHRMNILTVDGAPVFADLETIAFGPIEWDLAHLETEVAQAYPCSFDGRLLARCRTGVSAATATWCWGGLDRGPDMRAHAEHHLALVRGA